MPETPEVLIERIRAATTPAARNRLLARGLARGMIWRDGQLPEGSPDFSRTLSADLLNHGFGILARALRLRAIDPTSPILNEAFRVAAEAIESSVRRGPAQDPSRGFYLLVAALSSHLGGYAARAYSLLGTDLRSLNLTSTEALIALVARRSLDGVRTECVDWLGRDDHGDDALAARVLDAGDSLEHDEVLVLALSRNAHRAVGLLDSALADGDEAHVQEALDLLRLGKETAGEAAHVTAWWVHSLLEHLVTDIWDTSLWRRVPASVDGDADEQWGQLREQFIQVLSTRKTAEVTLWPSQLEAAARAINASDDLVIALPTSAGKTRIAELCILRALADGRRVVYLTPLRALSAQLERTLARTFRPLGARVSSLYGASGVARADIASFENAEIVVATPEKLDFALRHQPSVLDEFGLVVLDEGHMIGVNEREVRYEALVQRLLSRADADTRRLVCLSAIFGPGELTGDFTRWIRSDSPGTAIESSWRPTRHRPSILRWNGERGRLDVTVEDETPFVPAFITSVPPIPPQRTRYPRDYGQLVLATADRLISDGANVLVYCTQRNYVESLANTLLDVVRRGYAAAYPRPENLDRALRIGEEWLGRDHVAVKALNVGVAVHHGGLPRAFLAELETMLTARQLRFAIASPTVAQGLDLSASALVFHSLHRAGQPITAEEYKNVVGRVGRAFVDLDGISILPVDTRDARAAGRKLALFRELSEGSTRTLESGIALLIEELISLVATAEGLSPDAAVEYLLGQQGAWTVSDEATRTDILDLVRNLDAAILSTVEDLETPREEVADALDLALRNSLWRRTIDRRSESERRRQERLLVGRAEWIWERTTGPMRRGFFATGLGFDTGVAIDQNIERLSRLVATADAATAAGDLAAAATALFEIIEQLDGVPPFSLTPRPADAQALLVDWIGGRSIASAGSQGGEFIHDGLVYRLVWAVEAIRAYAENRGVREPDTWSGEASVALTFGVPTAAAAALIGHGLPSRTLAMDVSNTLPPEQADAAPDAWIDFFIETIDPAGFEDTRDAELWAEFASPSGRRIRQWRPARIVASVQWATDRVEPGTQVRLVPDTTSTTVCGTDLTPLGSIDRRITHVFRATVTDSGEIEMERFGPPL